MQRYGYFTTLTILKNGYLSTKKAKRMVTTGGFEKFFCTIIW